MMKKFLGSWQLITVEFKSDDGDSITPLGRNPRGLLIYLDNGLMSAQLHSDDRENFVKNDQMAGTDTEVRAAFVTYAGYYGMYEIDQERQVILHRVQGSMFPNQSGTTLERFFSFSNDDEVLTLTTAPFPIDEMHFTAVLVWARVY